MAKKKSKSESDGAAEAGWFRPMLLRLVAVAILLGAAGYGYLRLRNHVARTLAVPATIPEVTIKQRPAWMSDTLAEQIARSVRPTQMASAMDSRLLQAVAESLAKNAWVKQVKQVRRSYGRSAGDLIVADCEFRAPMALVAKGNEYFLVDADGVRLPERFVNTALPRIVFTADNRINIRVIDGVAANAPAQDGQKWPGDDLQAGLDMAKLLYGKPMAEEIHRINVTNFHGRKSVHEPQIVLGTKYKTEIRWGEPVKVTFHAELTPSEKLARLDRVRQQYGRIDGGHTWLDIRLDKITYPADEATVVRADGTSAAGAN